MQGEALKGHLDVLLLSAIRGGPSHGYAIIETLRRLSGGAFDLPEGTIYPALHRLEQLGWVESRWATDAPRRRRVYELTARGERELTAKAQEWTRFATAVNAVLGGTA